MICPLPGLTIHEGFQPKMEWGGGRSKNVAASGAARRNFYYQPAPAASVPTVPSFVHPVDENELARMEAKYNTQQKRLTSQKLYAKRAARTYRGTSDQGMWRWEELAIIKNIRQTNLPAKALYQ